MKQVLLINLHDTIRDLLGHKLINEIDFEVIEDFKISLKLKNRTTNIVLSDLKRFLEWCQDNGWIKSMPKIKRLTEKKEDSKVSALSREEFETLIKHANDTQKYYLWLMVYTGMRPAEATLLEWTHIGDDYIDIISDNPKKSDVFLYTQN